MRHIFILQLIFFLGYGLISGAAFTELKEQHKKEIAALLIRIPIKDLGDIKIQDI